MVDQLMATTEPSAKQWLFSLMNSLSHADFVKLAVTWATWSARRKAIYEGVFESPHSTHTFIGRFVSELDIIQQTTSARSSGGNTNSSPV